MKIKIILLLLHKPCVYTSVDSFLIRILQLITFLTFCSSICELEGMHYK